nr:hypothetical protein [Tanacetum cinerariifolium]
KKCFVCGSKSHLIKDCHVYDTVDNVPFVVLKAASVPAGSRNSLAFTSAGRSIPDASRNRSASIHAGRSIHAANRNRSASIHADRSILAGRINNPAPFLAGSSVPTGWTNPAARPFFRPTNLYFNNVYWPSIYDHMSMNEGRWGKLFLQGILSAVLLLLHKFLGGVTFPLKEQLGRPFVGLGSLTSDFGKRLTSTVENESLVL